MTRVSCTSNNKINFKMVYLGRTNKPDHSLEPRNARIRRHSIQLGLQFFREDRGLQTLFITRVRGARFI